VVSAEAAGSATNEINPRVETVNRRGSSRDDLHNSDGAFAGHNPNLLPLPHGRRAPIRGRIGTSATGNIIAAADAAKIPARNRAGFFILG
jgi:hypothetical protein